MGLEVCYYVVCKFDCLSGQLMYVDYFDKYQFSIELARKFSNLGLAVEESLRYSGTSVDVYRSSKA